MKRACFRNHIGGAAVFKLTKFLLDIYTTSYHIPSK